MEFKELDVEGEETLNALANANNFNEYMFEAIRPFCKGNILEIGSGIGNISQFFINNGYQISLSDVRDQYTKKLSSSFPNQRTYLLDIVDANFESEFNSHLGSFDTVYALNVVEHIEDHVLALKNMSKLLAPGGNLVILVPAYQWLYNNFDKELFHYRRYTRKSLNLVMDETGLNYQHSFYFNAFGIIGWFGVGTILKKKIIPEGNMKMYNRLVPMVKLIDKALGNNLGLSVISVYRKSN